MKELLQTIKENRNWAAAVGTELIIIFVLVMVMIFGPWALAGIFFGLAIPFVGVLILIGLYYGVLELIKQIPSSDE